MLHALRQRPLQARNIKARFVVMKDNCGKSIKEEGKGREREKVYPLSKQNKGKMREVQRKKNPLQMAGGMSKNLQTLRELPFGAGAGISGQSGDV